MQNRHMWADIMNGKLPLMPGAFPQAAPSSAEADVLATPSHREASIQSSRNRWRTSRGQQSLGLVTKDDTRHTVKNIALLNT